MTRFMAMLRGGPDVAMHPFKPEIHNAFGIISAAGAPLSTLARHFLAELASTFGPQIGPAARYSP